MGFLGPWKRIRIMDEMLLIFAGTPGFDTKLVLKPLRTDYHVTISMRHGSDWLAQPTIPIDAHKTYEGAKKEYEPLGRGSFKMRQLAGQMMQRARPEIAEVDLNAPAWRGREVVTFDERLAGLFAQKELNVTLDWIEKFAPVPASQLDSYEFGIGVALDGESPGFLVKGDSKSYSIGLPGLKGLEDTMSESMEFETFGDGCDDPEEGDDEDAS
jgi:hypothetical protein